MGKNHFFLSIKLAWKDLRNEPILSLCMILSITAVLAPLIVIAGLRSGVMNNIRQNLLEDPHALEIVNIANSSFTARRIKQLADRSDVQFLIPRTRTLAASLFLEKPDQLGIGKRVMVIPTANGDPLLKNLPLLGNRNNAIILSSSAAASLNIKSGDNLLAYLGRIVQGAHQDIKIPLQIITIAPPSVTDQDAAFVTLPFAVMVEAYQNGLKNWPKDLQQLTIPDDQVYAGFRLYADKLFDVPELDQFFRRSGIDVLSKAGEVQGLLSLDQRLTLLFMLVASLGGGGMMIALGAGLWANTERKQKSLAMLRFSGLSAFDLMIFPMIQGCFLTIMGCLLAVVLAIAVGTMINHIFINILPMGNALFLLTTLTIIKIFFCVILGTILIAIVAGRRSARVQPWEGMVAL